MCQLPSLQMTLRKACLFLPQHEVIRVTPKRNPIKTTYTIHGHDLTVNKTGQYLGVTIADNLTWNAHVDTTSKKANNSLAFPRRNLASCPRDNKAQSYQALVRLILEYASTSWDPYTKSNIQQLEAVQRHAARFVMSPDYRTTSSPSQMVADLGWKPLYQGRANFKLVMLYCITYGLIDIQGPPLYLHPSALSTRGHTLPYMIPYCRTDVYRNSFFPSANKLWNQLPLTIVAAPTLDDFKMGLASQG